MSPSDARAPKDLSRPSLALLRVPARRDLPFVIDLPALGLRDVVKEHRAEQQKDRQRDLGYDEHVAQLAANQSNQMSLRLITAMKNYVKVLMKAFNNVPNCRNNDWKQGQYVAKGS